MGFPKKWEIMIPLRMLLGLFEAGFFPGCVYLLSISPFLSRWKYVLIRR